MTARGKAKVSTTRNTSERGAAVVETALVMPLLVMLLVGIVSASAAYEKSSAIKNASRETSRYGATLPVDGDLSAWLVNVSGIAVASTTGDLDLTKEGHSVCIAYVYPDGSATDDRTLSLLVNDTSTVEGAYDCFTDGRPDAERRVQVIIQRGTTLEAVFFSHDVVLTGEAAARFERDSS
jgi:hypothetical protein